MGTNVDYAALEKLADTESEQQDGNGRLYSIDAEMSLIGAMLINPGCVTMIRLKKEDFFSAKLGALYEAIQELVRENHDVDVTTLADRMKLTREAKLWLYQLASRTPSSMHYETYADIIEDKARRRNIITMSKKLVEIANSEKDTTGGIASVIESLTLNAASKAETISIAQASEDYHEDLTHRMREGISGGFRTGFQNFDRYTGGFRPSQLVYLAGEPGVGKSIWASQVLLNVSRTIPSVCYSIEMGKLLTTERMIANLGKLDQEHLQNATLDESEKKRYKQAIQELKSRKLFINQSSDWDLVSLKGDIMRRKMRDGVQFVVLDYAYLLNESLQLDEIARTTLISRGLKLIADELNVALLVIHSINKEGMGRGPDGKQKRLSMANLRGSGQVLHDADLILFLQDYDPDIQKLTLTESELENIKYLTTQKGRTLKRKKLGIFVKHPDYPIFTEYIDNAGEVEE